MRLVERGGGGTCGVCGEAEGTLAPAGRRTVLRVCTGCAAVVEADRCAWCGGQLRRAATGRPAVYCGAACRTGASRLREAARLGG